MDLTLLRFFRSPGTRRAPERSRGRRWRRFTLAALGGAMLTLLLPGAALAHERREVGPYTFVVGFINEPAIQGQPNGIDLRVTRTDTGEPVTGVQQTLRAAIAYGGGQPKELPLRARFGLPGQYAADVIPTRPGSYIFTFTGTIEGTPINQRFESGPGRFNDVDPVERLQFPDQVPAGAALATSVREAEERATAAEERVAAAESRLGQASALAAAGAVLGLVGTALGGTALLRARRPAGAAA